MNKFFALQLTLMFLTINSFIHCMHSVPTRIKSSFPKTKPAALFYSIKTNQFKEDKMAYYKQFCPEINLQDNNRKNQSIQTFTYKNNTPQMEKEDKMAYYKQFLSKKE